MVIRRLIDALGFSSSKKRQHDRNCRYFEAKSKDFSQSESDLRPKKLYLSVCVEGLLERPTSYRAKSILPMPKIG